MNTTYCGIPVNPHPLPSNAELTAPCLAAHTDDQVRALYHRPATREQALAELNRRGIPPKQAQLEQTKTDRLEHRRRGWRESAWGQQ